MDALAVFVMAASTVTVAVLIYVVVVVLAFLNVFGRAVSRSCETTRWHCG